MRKTLLALILFSIGHLNAIEIPDRLQDVEIRIKDPTYENAILTTTSGGLIQSPELRIQAKNIEYDKQNETVRASGDLMVAYDGRIFIGETFTYDFIKKEGEMTEGKTYDNLWIIGGERIEFQPDNSILVKEAFMTASETDPPEYELTARELKLENKSLLTAKSTKFRVARIPVFYLPIFKANLDAMRGTRIKYKMTWDKGQGPKLSMRYRIYSWEEAALFLRLDLRTSRGVGGAFETDYKSKSRNLSFQTKNYLAHDTFYRDENPNRKKTRWRLQGVGKTESEDKNTTALIRYDYISDRNMPGDFQTDDFELNTAQRTELFVNHIHPNVVTDLYVRPNINKFQGFKQQLPTIRLGLRPVEFGTSKIMMNNAMSASFLDYEYPKDLGIELPGFQSARVESDQSIYRPFDFRYLTVTPSVGYEGIFYSNTPKKQSVITNILKYGVEGSTLISRHFTSAWHTVKPYVAFTALRPMKNHNHYVFGLGDGYEPIKELKLGVVNSVYTQDLDGDPRFSIDAYALRFFGTPYLSSQFAKLGADIELNFPSLGFRWELLYNNVENLYDLANGSVKWTLNDSFAIGLDFSHRSRFMYRKDNRSNYILDTHVPATKLLDSPISFQRNLFLATFELTLPPNWTLRFQSQVGWALKNQPHYAQYRIDLMRMITSHWKLRVSYMHTTDDDQFTFGLNLVSF